MNVDCDHFSEIGADLNRLKGYQPRQLLDMLRCQFDFVQVRVNLLLKRHFTRHLILDRRTYSDGTSRARHNRHIARPTTTSKNDCQP